MGNGPSRVETTAVVFPLMDLPAELRKQIYDTVPTLESPTHILIEPHPWLNTHRTRSSRTVPALLHTSYESRDRQSRHTYIQAFGSIDRRPRYFNPHRDVLHLRNTTPLRVEIDTQTAQIPPGYGNLRSDFANIRNLAIYGRSSISPHQVQQLLLFPQLAELQIGLPDVMIEVPRLRGPWIIAWTEALEEFWENEMNPEQVRLGLPETRTPVLRFLDDRDVNRFDWMFFNAREAARARARARRRNGRWGFRIERGYRR